MTRSYKQVALFIALAAVQSTASALEYHGYFRSGVGNNSKSGDQVCFKLPGAGAKYRLGNECETYADLLFSEQLHKDDSGAWSKLHTRMTFNLEGEFDYERDTVGLREGWVEIGGVTRGQHMGSASFWVGKRYYHRNSLHLNDFFYWNSSAPGAGIADVAFGESRFHYSYFRIVTDPVNGNAIDRAITSHDLRLTGVPVSQAGSMEFGLAYAVSDAPMDQPGEDGWSINIRHLQQALYGGSNTLSLQYGGGSGAAALGSARWDDTAASDARTWRISDELLLEPGGDWSWLFALVVEQQNDIQRWDSFGVRPIYHFDKHFSLTTELGFDRVTPQGGTSRQLTKFTLAPEIGLAAKAFARPVLRAFVTYASWDDAAQAQGIAEGRFGADTSGMTFGFQAEVWW